jgi:hypothetical protein
VLSHIQKPQQQQQHQHQRQQQGANPLQERHSRVFASAVSSRPAAGPDADSISSSSSCSTPQDAPVATAAAAAAAAPAAGASADDTGECSYVASLLRHATAEHLHWVLTWSRGDWQQYWRVRMTKHNTKVTHIITPSVYASNSLE